ncbi:type IV secretory pathway VirB6 component (fragment) [Escherichia coli]
MRDAEFRAMLQASRERNKHNSYAYTKEGANKRGNSSRLTQSFHFFMFEPIFSPVNALNQPI